ncbi:MAG: M48 family metallopeptidase [Saprospiraceae bacterium]|jgi:predicted Zn-dependent protease
MFSKNIILFVALASASIFWNCSATKKSGGGFNFFTLQDDIALGKEFSKQIEADPKTYPILPEAGNAEVYRYIRGITNKILNTGKVAYRKEFAWEVKIIDDDKTLNAFAVAGGYLYVYTGLIKYLDTEDQLAGVMGHEIAHAAQRHSTRQLSKIYGIDAIRQILTGNEQGDAFSQLALTLISLKFSRKHEAEADEYSVIYLCPTDYNAAGAAGFFEKIQAKGEGERPPEFLSTHPDPGNRVKDIKSKKQSLACTGNNHHQSEYDHIKELLK